jgi:NDP-sugar pyrophosphorylase family protein
VSLPAGVIAAGHGERLKQAGVIKPLVSVLGAPLSAWVLRSLAQAGVREVTLLHNSRGRELRARLSGGSINIGLSFLEADTASSFESFRLVSRHMAKTYDGFLMSTIDAIIPPAEVARFAAHVEKEKPLAGLALTSFVDDEKPLWAELSGGRVTALGPAVSDKRLVTAGLYYMTRAAVERMPEAAAFSSLREFLISLVESGAPVAGCELSKTVDVDRPEDVLEAESYLRSVTW